MNRPHWFGWWKRARSRERDARPYPKPSRRSAAGPRLAVEELGPRWLPSATDLFRSALPFAPNSGPVAGVIRSAPAFYNFTVSEPGRLVAEVAPPAGATRLTLWAADGTVLVQSDGQSPTNPAGRIDIHLAGSAAGTTYYLEVEGLGGAAGPYTLRADYAPATPPFQVLRAHGALWGHPADLNGDGISDLVTADFDGNQVSVLIGRGDGTFAPAADYTVGGSPNDVIAADLNGDGIPDLVSANFDGSLSVLLGRGGGSFASQVNMPFGVNPSALVAGDFDGNGHTDLAVSDYGTGIVSVLPGNGDGTFGSPAAYNVGNGPYEMVAGDFDGDRRTDLAVSSYDGATVTLLLGDAGGTFRPGAVTTVGETPYGMAVADYNGDGILDLASANFNPSTVSVLLGRGDGTFTTETLTTEGNPYSVTTGDFNGDGVPDLATSDFADGTLSVFAGRGDGTFAARSVVPVGASPAMLFAGDFNGDGQADLVHGDYTGHVSVDLGRGDGTFLVPAQPAPGGGMYDVVTGDFDRDGRLDVAAVNYSTSDVQIFFGRADGTFRAGGRYATGSDSSAAAAGDLNGDGIADLVVSNYSTADVSVLLGRGDGSFGPAVHYATGSIPYRAVLKDLNGDGTLDIVTPNLGSGTASVRLGRGDGTFADRFDVPVGADPASLAVGDFNGDGVPDLAAADTGSDDVALLFGRGDGTFAGGVRLATGTAPHCVVGGDFNGDGVPDLATADTGDNRVSVFLGRPGGGFQPRTSFPANLARYSLMGTDLQAADLNGDGRLDLAAVDYANNRLGVFFGRGDGTFRAGQLTPTGDAPYGIAVGDFNGDGAPDLLTGNFATSDMTVLLNAGDGTFGRRPRTPEPLGPVAAAVGDVNFDSFPDLVTADYDAGTVSVRLGRGDGTYGDPVTFTVGAGPDAVVLADGNRDGRPDIIAANSLDGTVSVLLGLGDGTFLTGATLPVGTTPDALAAGDLNGDGFTDLVTADSGSGDVTILVGRPHGSPTTLRYAVGRGPSAVALDDFNGDGRPDIVVTDALSRDVTVLLGNGDGTFQTLPAVPVGVAPVGVATADVNGDGFADVMTANPGDGSVAVLLGRGDGTFRAPSRIAVGTTPVSVAVGDFDGDGTPDLAVADSNANTVAVLRGRGDGTFQAQTSVSVGSYPLVVVADDFNCDGRLDLATTNGLGTPLTVMLGLGAGAFTPPGAALPAVAAPPLVADFNGDGIPDVVNLRPDGTILYRAGRAAGRILFASPVVVNPDPNWAARSVTLGTSNGVAVLYTVNLRTNTDAVYAWVGGQFLRVHSNDYPTTMPSAVVIGDVNGDGADDLVVGSSAAGAVYIGLHRSNDDLSTRVWDYQLHVGAGFSGLTLADVNGDGLSDLVATEMDAGMVTVLLNDRVAPFSTRLRFRVGDGPAAVTETDGGPRVGAAEVPVAVALGMFDGDAVPDLAVLNRGTHEVVILHGDGHGGFFDPVPGASLRTGSDPIALATCDFNLDGHTDLAVLNRGSADVSIFLSDGTGGFVEVLSPGPDGRLGRPSAGHDPIGLTIVDLNGDGLPDVLISNRTGDLLDLAGDGDGTVRPYERIDPHVALAVADQDGDGRYELALAERARDRLVLNTDGVSLTFEQGRSDGVNDPETLRFGDLNGDGIADLIVANAGSNSVAVYLAAREGVFGPARHFFVGTDPTGIAVGDLNADGIPDLVVTNSGSNDVSCLFGVGRGTDWSMTPGPRLRVGSAPVAAVIRDADGDGIPDIFVANSGSDTVYLLRGLGAGFFDDRRPVVFHTGSGPEHLFVGNFDNQVGLDLVTVNAGSNDLSLFSGFGAGRTITLAGTGPVQAVAGDFTGRGTLGLIVASQDGQFTWLQGGANGLQVQGVFGSGLAHVSDVGLAGTGGGAVQLYVTLDGRAEAVPVSFTFDSAGTGGHETGTGGENGGGTGRPAGGTGTEQSPRLMAEFSTLPGAAAFELLASLTLGTSVTADDLWATSASYIPGAEAVGTLPAWYASNTGGDEDVTVPDDGGPADPSVVGRNALIAGAADKPLREYLDHPEAAGATPRGVPFPSPLEWFDDAGRTGTAPDVFRAVEVAPVPRGEAPSAAPPEDGAGAALGPDAPAENAPDRLPPRALAVYFASVAAFLGWPVLRRRRPTPPAFRMEGAGEF